MADVMICLRVENCSIRPPLGSKQRWCARCNRAVFITPASLQMATERALTIVCVECGKPDMQTLSMMPPSAEQLREIADNLGD